MSQLQGLLAYHKEVLGRDVAVQLQLVGIILWEVSQFFND